MGVKGLQTYIETHCKTAFPLVSIQELVEGCRKPSQDKLIIVVDGSSCIRHLYGDLEWIGGSQLKQFGDIAQHFVQSFESLGIELVFFFDGPTKEKKRSTWVKRRITTVERIKFVLDEIEKGKPSDTIPKTHFHLPPGMGQLSRVVFEIICRCKVFQSLEECDEEIAKYARKEGVFAILGQDSDFVIFDCGQALYLSMQHLNIDTMTTRIYDRRKLAYCLNIHTNQLPLLATIMGNDIIKAEDLKPFHQKLAGGKQKNFSNFKWLPKNIANFIRDLPSYGECMNDSEALDYIAYSVLGDERRARDIRTSLGTYDTQPLRDDHQKTDRGRADPWKQLLAEAKRKHQTNKFPSMVYTIMAGLPFESSSSLEDFRLKDLPSFAEATQVIRAHVYGILLQEKPLRQGQNCHEVSEWCMAGPGSLDKAKLVAAVLPKPKHRGLKDLWSDRSDSDLTAERWRLFVGSVSHRLDPERLRKTVRSYMVIPVLILFFFNDHHSCLQEWEIDAMLATAACLKHYDVAKLAELSADPLTSRGIRVSNLLMRTTFVLYFLMAACGYPLTIQESAPWNFFDGKLFQLKYRQAESSSHEQLCEHKVDSLEDFQQARAFVFNDKSI